MKTLMFSFFANWKEVVALIVGGLFALFMLLMVLASIRINSSKSIKRDDFDEYENEDEEEF